MNSALPLHTEQKQPPTNPSHSLCVRLYMHIYMYEAGEKVKEDETEKEANLKLWLFLVYQLLLATTL